ncbi:hypothetical protein CC86DRAFT_337534, partial [Ophiobolus disseminans]
MDRASQALAEVFSAGESAPYRAISEKSGLKAQSQQYLTPNEEKALVKFMLLMSSLGHPVRIKFIPSLAFSIARRRSTVTNGIKPPGKNWPRAFERRHKELKARRVRAIDWKRHESNIYPKM